MEETLHPIRRFYRQHFARYAWARRAKPVVLSAWFGYRHFRYVITWRLHYSIHKIIYSLSQFLHAFDLIAARLAYRLRAQTPHHAKTWRHGLFFYISRAISNLGDGAAHLASWMQQASKTGFSFFSMVSLPEYCHPGEPVAYALTPEETEILAMPTVYPRHYRQHFCSETWPLTVPAVRAIEIPDAEVLGRCDFVFTRSQCLHHGLYQFERDLPAEEMHGMISMETKKRLAVRYAKTHEPVETLPRAISLIGSASANYVHWLTETAPKLALIDEIAKLNGLPLIIDADLHPNILESLHCLNTHERKLVPLKRGQICKVHKLISITPVAYAPFDYRRKIKPEQLEIDPGWAMFVPRGLYSLRKKLLHRLADDVCISGRRLFLRRISQYRKIHNGREVEAFLHVLGFQMVEPETLSFADQVRLFSRADVIVAQAGAALGNMVFAPDDCHVVILSAWSPFSIYYYFSNLASILGQRCTYVLCDPDKQDHVHPAHKGLNVDIHALREAIGR